jgi:site-specific DNA recombinase
MSKRAIIYGRVSRDDRDNDSRNLNGQIDMGRDHATKQDYAIVAEMPEDDRGASGAEIDLPQLNQIRAMAAAGEFDVLIVREIDRLSRNLAKQLIVEEEFKKAGVQIEYVIGDYPDTPEGQFMKHVRASVAEFEREKIIERMARGRDLKIKAGSVMVYSRPPYGYSVERGANGKYTLIVSEAEAQIVRLMFNWYTLGDESGRPLSITSIARRLTIMQVPTASDLRPKYAGYGRTLGPCHWAPAVVSRILGNEVYIGLWRWGKTKAGRMVRDESAMLTVAVPPIIDGTLFAVAAVRRATNLSDHYFEPKWDYLLSRRLTCKCGYCLAAWANTNGYGTTFLYYRCAASKAQGRNVARPCREKVYRASVIDAAVWEWIEGFMSDPESLRNALLEAQAEADNINAPARAEIQTIDSLIADNQTQAERLKDGYQSGIYTKAETVERKARIDDTLRALRTQREASEARFAKNIITDERIETILALADRQAEKVKMAGRKFDVRRELIEALDVRAVVWREAGQIKIDASCIIGGETITNNRAATSAP